MLRADGLVPAAPPPVGLGFVAVVSQVVVVSSAQGLGARGAADRRVDVPVREGGPGPLEDLAELRHRGEAVQLDVLWGTAAGQGCQRQSAVHQRALQLKRQARGWWGSARSSVWMKTMLGRCTAWARAAEAASEARSASRAIAAKSSGRAG